MKSGTRILLAVLTLFLGVIVLYWGVFYRGGEDEPVLVNDPASATSDDVAAAALEDRHAMRGDLVSADDTPSSLAKTRSAPQAPGGAPVLGREESALGSLPDVPAEGPADDGRQTSGVLSPSPMNGPGASSTVPTDDVSLANRAESAAGTAPESAEAEGGSQPPPHRPPREEPPERRSTIDEARTARTPYVVKAGDTLSSIAQEWFGEAARWDLIQQANPALDPRRLRIGQVLLLPAKSAARPTLSAVGGATGTYTVRSGDTLSSIARARLGEERYWRLIYEANRHTIGSNPDTIRVGMELIIPVRPPAAGS
jgi:nucleoid-associated protein YgaU